MRVAIPRPDSTLQLWEKDAWLCHLCRETPVVVVDSQGASTYICPACNAEMYYPASHTSTREVVFSERTNTINRADAAVQTDEEEMDADLEALEEAEIEVDIDE